MPCLDPRTRLARRRWLRQTGALGGWLGAAALLGPRLALAAPAGSDTTAHRLVVVLLRGGLDGLGAVPAPGDPAWAERRPQAAAEAERLGQPWPLDRVHALHPRLVEMQRAWAAGELVVLHATAQPYRERSHFDAQQMLESGGERPFALSTGWLGRALAAAGLPGLALVPALPLALRGAPLAGNWTPSPGRSPDEDLLARLGRLYQTDPVLAPLWQRALEQQSVQAGTVSRGEPGTGPFATLARQAGQFLAQPEGPRLAWLELGGWDTHTGQAARLARALGPLDDGLAALRGALGERWADTTVLVMTEFGRSAAYNGSGGTDHGTAGAAFLLGGRVRGGRVLGDWPGLHDAGLLDGRDLRPTTDLRRLQRAVLDAHWPLTRRQIETDILPGAPAPLPDLFRT